MNSIRDLYNLRLKSKDDHEFNRKVYRRITSGLMTQGLFLLYLEVTQTKYCSVEESLKNAVVHYS